MLLKIPFVEFQWNGWWMYECLNYKFLNGWSLLISSQVLFELSASNVSVHINPFDFACANLVLLLLVKSEAVSISMNQSSNCEELLLLKIVISWSRVFAKDIFFCAVHEVSVYCCETSSRGPSGADRQSVRAILFSLHCRWLMVSVGWVSLASTFCHKLSH